MQILYDTRDKVIGIATNDMGVAKDGSRKDNFQPGVELKGKFMTLFYLILISFEEDFKLENPTLPILPSLGQIYRSKKFMP